MISMITALLPFALKLVGYFLDKRAADIETKKAWLNFIEVMGSKGLVSKSLHDSYASQGTALDEEIKRLKSGG